MPLFLVLAGAALVQLLDVQFLDPFEALLDVFVDLFGVLAIA